MSDWTPERHAELTRRTKRRGIHSEKGAIGFKYRSACKLLTMTNGKTPKGEKAGYLSAILYLMPHDSGGGHTLCPHSTPACREMCLAGSGLSGLPKAMKAKQNRTDFWLGDPQGFIRALGRDIEKLKSIAVKEGLLPAVRLNGTSDIMWEREAPVLFPWAADVQFYDYTKIPLHHRRPPTNYHLTFSIEGSDSMSAAIGYLRAGHSVAAVVPPVVQAGLSGLEIGLGGTSAAFIDGDEHDLRFLDAPGSVVLLRPKGHIRTGLVRPDILHELRSAARA